MAPSIIYGESTTVDDCLKLSYESQVSSAGIRQASFFEVKKLLVIKSLLVILFIMELNVNSQYLSPRLWKYFRPVHFFKIIWSQMKYLEMAAFQLAGEQFHLVSNDLLN